MNKKTFLKAHIIYWSIFIVIAFFAYTFPHYTYNNSLRLELFFWIGVVFNFSVSIAEFYFYYLILVPKCLLNKLKPIQYILISFLIIPITSVLRLIIWNRVAILNGGGVFDNFFDQYPPLIYISTFYPMLAILVSILEVWVSSEIEKNKLKNLTIDSKINFLKSQINPHFIFNTLNNIYSLSLKSKKMTGIALQKLQSTFKYLKKVEVSSTVSLNDTKEYILSYLELCKMRMVYPEKVTYTIDSLDENKRVYPMLFIPFIENAFKHSSLVEEQDFISISLTSHLDKIEMEVRNRIPSKEINKDGHSGVGLKNVKERLSLLFNKHEYYVKTELINDEFVAILKIPYAVH